MKRALITGVTGQDGAYLAANLLKKGYEVHGLRRRTSSYNSARLEAVLEQEGHVLQDISLHYADMSDTSSLVRAVSQVAPDEVYNLAAMSHVGVSFLTPEHSADVNGVGTLRLLEALKITGNSHTRFYQASTSELYGEVAEVPQSEKTPFHPRSPYAISKLFAYWTVVNYRESYGTYACNGILFNHESPFRGENFVTQKIVRGLVAIKTGQQEKLDLGNLDARRDWGHAREYVEMQHRMLQQTGTPEDYVIATGRQYSVRQFVDICSTLLGLDVEWRGEGLSEVGYSRTLARPIVEVNPKHFRPAEVNTLLGNAEKARKNLGWETRISIDELASEMIDYRLKTATSQTFY
jgi:GDPmannose 4,6-dehydratase